MEKNEFLEDLIGLLKIDSTLEEFNPSSKQPFGKKTNEALEYMLNLGKKNGFEVYNADGYAGHIEYGSGKEIIGILCHLDVVPAVGNWTNPPFEPKIEGDLIYARGAIDDKGPLMASFYALKDLKERNVKLNKRVRLIFGLDEETKSRCIKYYLTKCEMPDLSFSPDADFPLINGEKGIVSYDILGEYNSSNIISINSGDRYNIVPDLCCFKLNIDLKKEFYQFLKERNIEGYIKDDVYNIVGLASHAMIPNKGKNAIFLMAEFLKMYIDDKIINYIDEYLSFDCFGNKLKINEDDEKLGKLTNNVAKIIYENGKLLIGMNMRFPKKGLESTILEKLKQSINKYDFKVRMLDVTDPLYVSKEDPLVKTLLSSYKDVTGDSSDCFTIGGGTYSKALKKCVAFGANMPNKEDMCHKVDEYASITDLLKAKEIYELAIERLGEL